MLAGSRALIFDFDGLLADSERFHYESYNQVFARYGHRLDPQEYWKHWTSLGQGVQGEIERHGLKLDPAEIRRAKMPIFSRYCEDGTVRLWSDAKRMLEIFRQTGKRLAIASGTPASDVLAVLRNEGVERWFAAVVGSDTVQRVKPAPDVFLQTMSKLGVTPGESLVLEDAEKGMFAAVAASVPVIVILTPQTQGFDFSRADLLIESHREMVELLEKLTSAPPSGPER